MYLRQLTLLLFLLCCLDGYTQSKFNLMNGPSEKVRFQLIDNLIVIPVQVNGVELSFLLDSGVSKPILFNIVNLADSLKINEVESIYLQGLGGGESVEALKSKRNLVRIGNAINVNQDLYVVLDKSINFTPRLGIPVHGIIGYDILKDFVVEINYSREFLRFYEPEFYEYKSCNKCETLPLSFYNNKPYLDGIVGIRGKEIGVKLLIDSGGSDALWLFEDKEAGIYLEDEPYFRDFLGLGLSGSVYGDRSRIETFKLNSFELNEVNVAYPDSSSIHQARNYVERNGSIAGEILKRFNMIIDYKNAKITLRKNGMFRNSFEYNKSGLVLQQDGIRIVKEKNALKLFPSNYGREDNVTNTQQIEIIQSYRYAVRPAIAIAEIRPGSAASDSGLMVGDVVISINGDDTSKYTLQECISHFYGRDGKNITIVVDRDGLLMRFRFELQDMMKKK